MLYRIENVFQVIRCIVDHMLQAAQVGQVWAREHDAQMMLNHLRRSRLWCDCRVEVRVEPISQDSRITADISEEDVKDGLLP